MTIRIALIGYGKIAADEHRPAISADPAFDLVAIVSPDRPPDDACAWFATFDAMLDAMPGGVDAVAICTPPIPRFAIARQAIAAGFAVLLEKPPTATLGELDALVAQAAAHDVPMLTAWHSQYAAGVAVAEQALAGETVSALTMRWCEDVRVHHPGQQWIWDAGGFGVFDPAINGLSILTRILPEPLLVQSASMIIPGNRQAPIAADIVFHGEQRTATLDFRGVGDETWSIAISCASGRHISLTQGGARCAIDGADQPVPDHAEYPAIYRDFSALVHGRRSRIDREPLRIVADCFMVGERKMGEDFV